MSTTQKRMAVGLLMAFALALAVGGWFWWQERNQPPLTTLPPTQVTPKTSVTKGENTKGKKPTREEILATEMADLVVPSAGNVSKISQLQADIKEQDLELKLDEIKAKRAQLKAPSAPPASLPMVAKMPDLPMGNLSPAPVAPRPARQSVAVVSVQGVNERMSATIRASNGSLVTVQMGNSFGGGKVTHISRQGVTLRSGSKNIVLPFE